MSCALLVRLEKGISFFYLTHVDGKSRKGTRGSGRSNNPLPSAFDQQAFMEAIGASTTTIAQASVAAATIAQAGATTGQGGLSNLQRFKAHHHLTFRGGGDPMIVDHWFRKVYRILEAMEVTFDATQIRLETFQVEGESQVWWDYVRASRDLEAMTWEEFRGLFMEKYFSVSGRHVKV